MRQSKSEAPEVWVGPLGKWTKLTSLNGEVTPTWGKTENVHWTNGTARIQGWLTAPKEIKPGEKIPAGDHGTWWSVVSLHVALGHDVRSATLAHGVLLVVLRILAEAMARARHSLVAT